MKNKQRIISLLVCLLGVIALGYYGMNIAQERYEAFKTIANDRLKEALKEEIESLNTKPVPYISSAYRKSPSLQSLPDTLQIEIQSEQAKIAYRFPSSELQYNIVGTDGDIRGFHSYLLFEHPFTIDSLYHRWQALLPTDIAQRGKLGLRLKNIDVFQAKESVSYAPDSVSVFSADSLCTWNAGMCCEIKATAFVRPVWYRLLTWPEWMLLAGCLVCIGLVGIRWEWLCRMGKRLFVKEKVITRIEEREKIVEVEKPVPVVVTDCTRKPEVYQLREDLYFNATTRTLQHGEQVIHLSPRTASILQCFLHAPGYQLSKQELIDKFWPKTVNDPSHALQTAISRIRTDTAGLIRIEFKDPNYRLYI